MAEEPAPRVPNHTIMSPLGKGGMAKVYLARDDHLRRLVALKVIADRYEDSDDFRRRFEREARTAAGLSHVNIVSVYGYGFTEGGQPYISMAFLDGGSLRDRLKQQGARPIDEALTITRQIASALQAAHARNVVHRDLKPDNVMFQGENAVLTDFGIAKVLDGTTGLTGTGVSPGTVRYFSPEQARGDPLDQRSDIYTLGVVLYEMLTGRLPIEAESFPAFVHRISTRPPDPLPDALKGMQPFMDVLLAKDPAERLGTCGEIITIIDAMVRNWNRFGSADRLTDGLVLTPSRRHAATVSQDDIATPEADAPRATDPDAATVQLGATAAASRAGSDTFALPLDQTAAPAIPATDPGLVGTLHIEVTPSDATVAIDYRDALGEQCSELWRGRALRLPLGELRLLARAPGYVDVRRTVRLSGGRRDEVFELDAVPAAPPAVTQPQAVAASTAVTASARPPALMRNLAVAVALLVGATLLWFAMKEPGTTNDAASAPVVQAAPATEGAGAAAPAPAPRPNIREPRMVDIPAGCFTMGSMNGDADEKPTHQVCISRPFRAGVNEVTFDQYDAYVAASGAARPPDEGWGRGDRPVINVSWDEATAYARWLADRTGKRYRLLTEAEWEYVTRAGTMGEYWWGNSARHEYANYGKDECCDGLASGRDAWVNTSPVGSFPANSFGLHDTHGNVWEWVQDCYEPTYQGAPTDGRARQSTVCPTRVLRGGSWGANPSYLRSAVRFMFAPANRDDGSGIRLAQDI